MGSPWKEGDIRLEVDKLISSDKLNIQKATHLLYLQKVLEHENLKKDVSVYLQKLQIPSITIIKYFHSKFNYWRHISAGKQFHT